MDGSVSKWREEYDIRYRYSVEGSGVGLKATWSCGGEKIFEKNSLNLLFDQVTASRNSFP